MNRDDERIIEGMKLQLSRRPEGRRVGWKAGFGTEGGMDYLGIAQPLVGFLTESTCLDSGAAVDLDGWEVPLIEAEVAVKVKRDVPPGTSPDDAADSVGAVGAAIELIDLGSTEDVAEVVGGNIFHRKFLIGDLVECDRAGLDDLRISVTANGSTIGPSDPRDVIGAYGKIVAAVADQAELAGDRLREGDLIITGAAVPPAPFGAGDRFEVEIDHGSSVSVHSPEGTRP